MVTDVGAAGQLLGELKRAHAMGFKTVQLQRYPNGSGAPKPEDDEFWRTALDLVRQALGLRL